MASLLALFSRGYHSPHFSSLSIPTQTDIHSARRTARRKRRLELRQPLVDVSFLAEAL